MPTSSGSNYYQTSTTYYRSNTIPSSGWMKGGTGKIPEELLKEEKEELPEEEIADDLELPQEMEEDIDEGESESGESDSGDSGGDSGGGDGGD